MKAKLVYLSDSYTDYMAKTCFSYGRKSEDKYGRIYLELPERINGHRYCVPLSSKKKSDYSVDMCGNLLFPEDKIHSIPIIVTNSRSGKLEFKGTVRTSKMIPVPDSEVVNFDLRDPKYGFSSRYVKMVGSQVWFLSEFLWKIQDFCEKLHGMKTGSIEPSVEYNLMKENVHCVDFVLAEELAAAFTRGVESGVPKEDIRPEDFGCDFEKLRLARYEFDIKLRELNEPPPESLPIRKQHEPLWTPDKFQPEPALLPLPQPQQYLGHGGYATCTPYTQYALGRNPWHMPYCGPFAVPGAYNRWNAPLAIHNQPIMCVDAGYPQGLDVQQQQYEQWRSGYGEAYGQDAAKGVGVVVSEHQEEFGAVGGVDSTDKVGDLGDVLYLAAQLGGISIGVDGGQSEDIAAGSASATTHHVSEQFSDNQSPEPQDFTDGSVRKKILDNRSKGRGGSRVGKHSSDKEIPPRFRKQR